MRVLRFLAGSVIAVLAATFPARPAYAFCRTTTSQVPAAYDPTANGCWTQGTPLAWRTSEVTYGVGSAASQQVSLAEATRVADLAFGTWNAVTCPDGAPTVFASDEGSLDWVPDGGSCGQSSDCNPTAHDVIAFDDEVWPYNDPANTLALTTVTYGVDGGAIFEAYTEINTTPPHQVTTQEPPPEGSTAYDLQAILTHEAGHFFGLAHAPDTSAVMYAYYVQGKIDLTSDDVSGFCAIYPPLSNPLIVTQPTSTFAGCSMASSASPRGGATGPLLLAVALLAARRGRVRGRRGKAHTESKGSAICT
jgi:Matrixin